MAQDAGIGIVLVEGLQQFVETVLLEFGAGVARLADGIEAALIADGQRTVVEADGMDALDGLGEDGNDSAVAPHIVVIGGLPEAGHASGNETLDGEGTIAATAGAVDDEELDVGMMQCLHLFVFYNLRLEIQKNLIQNLWASPRNDFFC